MFCTDCGMRNSADSKYCKECGHKINDGYRTMMLSIEDVQAVQNEQNQERLTKLLDMAFWHNQAGNIEAAVLACEAALKIHPNSTTAHSLLGTLYEKKDNDAKAIEHFEAVVRLNPDSAADATKLDQVRRGVHVKAVQPPPAYKWLPPALVSFNWGKWKPSLESLNLPGVSRPVWPERLPKPSPLVAAGTVAGIVVVAGILALHPIMPVGASVRQAPPTRLGVIGSYTGPPSAAVAGSNGLLPPVVLKAGPNTTQTLIPVGPDPFGEILKSGTKTTPLIPAKRSSRSARMASRLAESDPGLSLPPLSLRAIPIPRDGGGLAPAPVAVPSGATQSMVPQHTVVVSSLNNAAYTPAQAVASAQPSAQYGASPRDLSSHIRISINNSPTDNSVSISDHDDPRPAVRHTTAESSADGDAYQQTALSLQQQGDFRRARTAYQQAIHAYKGQIAAGHDTDASSQGLAASQTGLEICEQSR